jgi:hypothetical protein
VGEFSPVGRLLIFGQFLKYKNKPNFFHGKSYVCQNYLTKMGWAAFWAIFLTNSSGHPGPTRLFKAKLMMMIVIDSDEFCGMGKKEKEKEEKEKEDVETHTVLHNCEMQLRTHS